MLENLLSALALLLVLEGLLPLVAPQRWRNMFEQLLQLHNGQLRYFGCMCVLAGLLLLWLVS